jgi:hypothetical protein
MSACADLLYAELVVRDGETAAALPGVREAIAIYVTFVVSVYDTTSRNPL